MINYIWLIDEVQISLCGTTWINGLRHYGTYKNVDFIYM